jgi:hypothetical protein
MPRWLVIGLLSCPALLPLTAGAGVVNPDISVVGQPFLHWTDDPADAARERASIQLGETEFVFDSYLNPYARGTFTVALHDGHVHLEEAYFDLVRGLPGGLALKGGRYRAGFGRLNPEHPHVYPFAGRFRVLAAYLPGDEAFIETGLGLSARFAAAGDVAITAAADWLQGDSFHEDAHVHEGEGEEEEEETETGPRPAALGRVSAFLPLGERSGLDLGVSATHGTNDVHAATRTTVLGADAKAKLWTSPRSYVLLQGEWLRLDREEARHHEEEAEPGSHRLTPWGAYVFADYNFALRYNVGASYERWQRADEDRTRDQAVGLFAGFSLMEETTAFRLGWEHFRPGGDGDPAVNTLTLRVIYSMGPHKAHRF